MAFEPTSAGNPYRLTKNQHFHMDAILLKFIGADNKVAIRGKKSGVSTRFSTANKRFKGNRAWSQELEQHISWPIERQFLAEVQRVEAGNVVEKNAAISTYHLLWTLRHRFALNPVEDTDLIPGLGGKMDQMLEELAESIGKLPLSEGKAKSRFATTMAIKAGLSDPLNLTQYQGIHWKVIRSTTTRFISADSYPTSLCVPVSPNIILLGLHHSAAPAIISEEEVKGFNELAVREATNFTFG